MDIIYSASPLEAFSASILVVAFLLGLGVVGALSAVFRKKESTFVRVILAGAGVVLMLTGVAAAVSSFMSYQTGDKVAVLRVEQKNEVESNCDNGGICLTYTVEATDGGKLFVFEIPKDAWDKVEIGACYEFTYYSAQPLLGGTLSGSDFIDSYETVAVTMRIVRAACS